VSWEVAPILFAISAFEGVRRVQPDDVILRRGPFGGWRVVSPVRLGRSWHLVSVLAPFFLTIVAQSDSDSAATGVDEDASDMRSFAGSIEPILALRVLGALDIVLVVIGIPWAVSSRGSIGLLAVLGCALALSAAIALRSATLSIRQGKSGIGFRKALSFLSPFASPLAAEAALSARARNNPQIAVISDLLGEAEFRAFIRPSVYDVELRGSVIAGSSLEEMALALPKVERTGILKSAGEGCKELERFCPRCAERYSLESTTCAECEGIALRLPTGIRPVLAAFVFLLGIASSAQCQPTRHSDKPFRWPLADIGSPDSAIDREVRISQDFGLGGPGPTIRIVVSSRVIRGEVYVTHWVSAAEDSDTVSLEKTLRDGLRSRYGCTSFVTVGNEAACRVPFARNPNWKRFLARLDSLLATAPPSPAPDPNLICADGSGWELADRIGTHLRRDASRYCGPGSPERERYEAAMWELVNAINRAAASR
jgi:hypothetical protein